MVSRHPVIDLSIIRRRRPRPYLPTIGVTLAIVILTWPTAWGLWRNGVRRKRMTSTRMVAGMLSILISVIRKRRLLMLRQLISCRQLYKIYDSDIRKRNQTRTSCWPVRKGNAGVVRHLLKKISMHLTMIKWGMTLTTTSLTMRIL